MKAEIKHCDRRVGKSIQGYRPARGTKREKENRTERGWWHGHRASIREIRNHRKKKKNGKQRKEMRKLRGSD